MMLVHRLGLGLGFATTAELGAGMMMMMKMIMTMLVRADGIKQSGRARRGVRQVRPVILSTKLLMIVIGFKLITTRAAVNLAWFTFLGTL